MVSLCLAGTKLMQLAQPHGYSSLYCLFEKLHQYQCMLYIHMYIHIAWKTNWIKNEIVSILSHTIYKFSRRTNDEKYILPNSDTSYIFVLCVIITPGVYVSSVENDVICTWYCTHITIITGILQRPLKKGLSWHQWVYFDGFHLHWNVSLNVQLALG